MRKVRKEARCIVSFYKRLAIGILGSLFTIAILAGLAWWSEKQDTPDGSVPSSCCGDKICAEQGHHK